MLVEAMDHLRYTSGFDAVAAGCELVVHILELGVEHLDFITDFVLLLSVSTEVLNLSGVLPFVEATHSITKCVVLGC